MQMTVFQAKTPAGEDLRTLLATHTMLFGGLRPAHYNFIYHLSRRMRRLNVHNKYYSLQGSTVNVHNKYYSLQGSTVQYTTNIIHLNTSTYGVRKKYLQQYITSIISH